MKPYTYLISWSKLGKSYYGVKYGKDANPDTFWKNYFTSSKHVSIFREQNGEPDVIKVDRVFDTAEEAREYEELYLDKVNAVKDEQWLNKHNSGRWFGGTDKGRPCTWGDKVSQTKKGMKNTWGDKFAHVIEIECSNGMSWSFPSIKVAKQNGIFELTLKQLRKGPYRVKYAKKIAGTIVEKGAVLTMKETRCTQSKQSLIR